MKRKNILENCKNIAKLFEVPLNYYYLSQISSKSLELTHIDAYGNSQDVPVGKKYSLEEKRKEHPMAYERWTDDQDNELKEKYQSGLDIAELASLFQRQTGAIRSRLGKLGLLQ